MLLSLTISSKPRQSQWTCFLYGKGRATRQQHETKTTRFIPTFTGERAVNTTTFWYIIDIARARSGNTDEHTVAEVLCQQLRLWSPEEIESFDAIFCGMHARSYSLPLWDAMRGLYGFVSYDGFDSFRAWLIMQGVVIYTQVLRHPEALVEFLVGDSYPRWELVMYCAQKAYKERTGRELPWMEKLGPLKSADEPANPAESTSRTGKDRASEGQQGTGNHSEL
jgi:hypothetical protein